MSYDSLCLVIAPLQSPLHCWRLSTVHVCCLFWYDSYLPVITADITGRAHCWMYVRITARSYIHIFTVTTKPAQPTNIIAYPGSKFPSPFCIVPTSRVLWYAPRRSETRRIDDRTKTNVIDRANGLDSTGFFILRTPKPARQNHFTRYTRVWRGLPLLA
jgi:hypothetical protein